MKCYLIFIIAIEMGMTIQDATPKNVVMLPRLQVRSSP